MKKNILALVTVIGLSATFTAGAANQAANKGFQGQGIVSSTECALLADQVTMNFSKNVWAAYACDEATSVIQVAACHQGGSRVPKEVTCTADPKDPAKFVPSTCKEVGEKVTISDYSGFIAGSNGGSVGQDVLGGACSDSTVTKLIK
ncbi:hypothetical protein [Stutzerimonas stutzeri]|uniref:hypothetical protein n=1 Tax=Stutzerimonas stutzeri TaxID=316 RepID=UPI000F7B14AF|nr:hypothetical protein [Stutzerimonas stutzeri]